MNKLHKNATTTSEVRTFIRQSDLATAVLARLLKVSESTVRKWRNRADTDDASHKPKHLNTTLTQEQEYVAVLLRIRLKLSLDELLYVCKKFINENASRAGLQRCLKRHGVSRLSEMTDYVHVDEEMSYVEVSIEELVSNQTQNSLINPQYMSEFLTLMRQQMSETNDDVEEVGSESVVQVYFLSLPTFDINSSKTSLLLAHDLTSKWVYLDLYQDNAFQAAKRYITYALAKAPFHIRRLLAKNYNEFLSRFRLLDEKSDQTITTENATKFKTGVIK